MQPADDGVDPVETPLRVRGNEDTMSYELNAIDRASRAVPPREVKRTERAEAAKPAAAAEPYRIPASPPAEVLHELDAAARVVEDLAARNVALSFSVDDATKKVRIEVKDSGTGQTIRTIPATSLLDALHSGGTRGMMVNELG
jgi:uncharacterized FlaG/YvyC family protein